MAIKVKKKPSIKEISEASNGAIEVISIKEAPVEYPKTNAIISKKSGKKAPVTIKAEEPLDPTVKKNLEKSHNPKTVGIALGATLNMGDYESLRADIWCTDVVRENETEEQALERIGDLVRARLDYEIEAIKSGE